MVYSEPHLTLVTNILVLVVFVGGFFFFLSNYLEAAIVSVLYSN